jgi:hypothetical protein
MVSYVRKQPEDVTFFYMLLTLVTTAVDEQQSRFLQMYINFHIPYLQKEGFQLCVKSKLVVQYLLLLTDRSSIAKQQQQYKLHSYKP